MSAPFVQQPFGRFCPKQFTVGILNAFKCGRRPPVRLGLACPAWQVLIPLVGRVSVEVAALTSSLRSAPAPSAWSQLGESRLSQACSMLAKVLQS